MIRLTLRGILIIPVTIAISIVTLIATYISFYSTEQTLEKSILDELEVLSSSGSGRIDAWLKDRTLDLSSWRDQPIMGAALGTGFLAKSSKKRAFEILDQWKEQYGYYRAIRLYNNNLDLTAYTQNGAELSTFNLDGIPSDLISNTGTSKVFISPASMPTDSDFPEIQLVTRILSKDKPAGYLVGTLDLGYVQNKILSKIKTGSTGYAVIADQDGSLVMHSSKPINFGTDFFGSQFSTLLQEEHKGINVELNEEKQIFGTSSLANINWHILVGVHISELEDRAGEVAKVNLISALFIIITVTCLLFYIANFVAKAIDQVGDRLHFIASSGGDLTSRIPLYKIKELRHLSEGFNEFVGNICSTISEVKNQSYELQQTMKYLARTSSQLVQNNLIVADETSSLSVAAEEMNATVVDVASGAEQSGDSAKGVAQCAEDGVVKVAQTITALQSISESIEETGERVSTLATQLNSMNDVLRVIEGIAEQTNLLALNAAIEAARAGDQGRGFAVVADEVRQLATETVKATQIISHSIQNTQKESTQALSAMKTVKSLALDGVELGTFAEDSMKLIENRVQSATVQSVHIAQATSELCLTIDGITENIDKISTEMSQSKTSLNDISSTIEQVNQRANSLDALAQKFKTA